jgi:small glutamine-rich tetratricopeptide repeat-containing protein alpha
MQPAGAPLTSAQAPNASHQRLALAIIDFLRKSQEDGTIPADDSESIEIATSCIAESFHVDPSDTGAMADALGGQNLMSIYSVYEKLKGKSTASTEGASSAKEGRPATPTSKAAPSAEARAQADALKAQGNAAMQAKDHAGAIDFYSKALDLVPLDPIFLSNRAAAYSADGKHEQAKADSEMAVAADPKYSKAWSRLGLARFALGDAKGAMEAYGQGIEAEGNGGSQVMRRGYETAKKKVEEEEGKATADSVEETARSPLGAGAGAGGMPDLSSLASMLGGGGGGGGGMPDFSQMMNNPMMKQMAENIMSNPDAMNNILSNPRLREMASQFGGGGQGGGAGGGSGGGMPDLSSLMNDPSIAEM